MKHDLGVLPYQIDFKTQDKPPHEIISWLNENTTRVQHLLDEEPRVSRWYFENLETALKAVTMIQESKQSIDYRLVCNALSGLFIQDGDF